MSWIFLGEQKLKEVEDFYINTGVVFYDRRKMSSHLAGVSELSSILNNMRIIANENNFVFNDQEFNLIYFNNFIKTADEYYNTQTHSVYHIKKLINNKKDKYNLHLNMWVNRDGVYKYDIHWLILSNDSKRRKLKDFSKKWVETSEFKRGKIMTKDDIKTIKKICKFVIKKYDCVDKTGIINSLKN